LLLLYFIFYFFIFFTGASILCDLVLWTERYFFLNPAAYAYLLYLGGQSALCASVSCLIFFYFFFFTLFYILQVA